jgi:hypothetical protein
MREEKGEEGESEAPGKVEAGGREEERREKDEGGRRERDGEMSTR